MLSFTLNLNAYILLLKVAWNSSHTMPQINRGKLLEVNSTLTSVNQPNRDIYINVTSINNSKRV